MRAALIAAFALLGAACEVCGTYAYKAAEGIEQCGIVYGTQGAWWDEPGEADGRGVYVLNFSPDAGLDHPNFTHTGAVEAVMLVDAAEPFSAVPPEATQITCVWTDYVDPRVSTDDIPRNEPPTEAELRFLRRAVNPDPLGPRYRRFAWDITCGEGVFHLKARDNVEMVKREERHPLHDSLRAAWEGDPDTADTGG